MAIVIDQIASGSDAGKFVLVEGDDILDIPAFDDRASAETARRNYLREMRQADADTRSEARGLAAMAGDMETFNDLSGDTFDDDTDSCSNQRGHEWAYTGSAYGGDDDSYHGEGRCYCVHCGADGDA